jgi:hypothetical protein
MKIESKELRKRISDEISKSFMEILSDLEIEAAKEELKAEEGEQPVIIERPYPGAVPFICYNRQCWGGFDSCRGVCVAFQHPAIKGPPTEQYCPRYAPTPLPRWKALPEEEEK